DQQGFAVGDLARHGGGNHLLGRHVREQPAVQRPILAAVGPGDATMALHHQTLGGEPAHVAPHRLGRDVERFGETGDGRGAMAAKKAAVARLAVLKAGSAPLACAALRASSQPAITVPQTERYGVATASAWFTSCLPAVRTESVARSRISMPDWSFGSAAPFIS